MNQTDARKRAKELHGIAVSARMSGDGLRWNVGGWPQEGDEWIVISTDRTKVLDDSPSPPVALAKAGMTPIEFQAAVNARIDWMRENHPELLEQPVHVIFPRGGERLLPVRDVFVEHRLLIVLSEPEE